MSPECIAPEGQPVNSRGFQPTERGSYDPSSTKLFSSNSTPASMSMALNSSPKRDAPVMVCLVFDIFYQPVLILR
jgi:hypothetical protein